MRWTYGPESPCADAGRDDEDILEHYTQFRSPNLQCWEPPQHRAPSEDTPPCEWTPSDFEALERGMGFHQFSIRLLALLLLNHLQLFIVRMVWGCYASKSEEVERAEDRQDDRERAVMATRLMPRKKDKSE